MLWWNILGTFEYWILLELNSIHTLALPFQNRERKQKEKWGLCLPSVLPHTRDEFPNKRCVTADVNNSIMELLILIYACKTSYAKSITVILPYLPYSKQCRVRRRFVISPFCCIESRICGLIFGGQAYCFIWKIMCSCEVSFKLFYEHFD